MQGTPIYVYVFRVYQHWITSSVPHFSSLRTHAHAHTPRGVHAIEAVETVKDGRISQRHPNSIWSRSPTSLSKKLHVTLRHSLKTSSYLNLLIVE
jgi:hypothetical protein